MATAETSNNAPETNKAEQPNTSNPRKRKVMLFVLALIVILGVLGVWGWYELYGGLAG